MLTKSEGFAITTNNVEEYISNATKKQVLELGAWVDQRKSELDSAGCYDRFVKARGGYDGDGIDYMIDGSIAYGESHFNDVINGDIPSECEGFVMYDLHNRADELEFDLYDELDTFMYGRSDE